MIGAIGAIFILNNSVAAGTGEVNLPADDAEDTGIGGMYGVTGFHYWEYSDDYSKETVRLKIEAKCGDWQK